MPARGSPRVATAALARVRKICLALPETAEKIAWGEPTFRVRKKLFVMFAKVLGLGFASIYVRIAQQSLR